jgi:hypothetical protein
MGFLFEIGLLMAVQTLVDFNNPLVLMGVRALYVLVAGAYYLAVTQLPARIAEAAAEDDKPIWVPVTKPTANIMDAMFGPSSSGAPPRATEYRRLTVRAYEEEIAKKAAETFLAGAVPPLMFSFFMNIHIMTALRAVRLPIEALQNPLIKRYFLNADLGATPDYKGAPGGGGELYEDPAPAAAGGDAALAGADSTAQGGSASSSSTGALSAPSGLGGRDKDMEEAVFRTWEAPQDPAPLGWYQELREKGKDINYRTEESGWTLLMVVAGGSQNGQAEVRKLLEMGARPELRDGDGWTALHWAAFHGCLEAINTITGAYGGSGSGGSGSAALGDGESLSALLTTRGHDGKTAHGVAVKEGNRAEAAALEAAARRCGLMIRDLADGEPRRGAGRASAKEEGEGSEAAAETPTSPAGGGNKGGVGSNPRMRRKEAAAPEKAGSEAAGSEEEPEASREKSE